MLVIKLTNILLLILILVVLMSSTSKEGFWSWSHNKTRLEEALKIVKEEQANKLSDDWTFFWIVVYFIAAGILTLIAWAYTADGTRRSRSIRNAQRSLSLI